MGAWSSFVGMITGSLGRLGKFLWDLNPSIVVLIMSTMKYINKTIEDRALDIATQVVSILPSPGGQSPSRYEGVSTKATLSFWVSVEGHPIFTIEEWRESHLIFRFPSFSPYRALHAVD